MDVVWGETAGVEGQLWLLYPILFILQVTHAFVIGLLKHFTKIELLHTVMLPMSEQCLASIKLHPMICCVSQVFENHFRLGKTWLHGPSFLYKLLFIIMGKLRPSFRIIGKSPSCSIVLLRNIRNIKFGPLCMQCSLSII